MCAWTTAHFLAADQRFINSCTLVAWYGAGQLRIWKRSATVRHSGRAQLRLRTQHRRTAPRWTHRKGSRRNQGSVQTYLPKRTEHFASPRQSSDDDPWRTSSRIPGLRCQCKEAWDLPVETWYGPRRFSLTTSRIPRLRLHTQPPWTGGMIAISAPGFSL